MNILPTYNHTCSNSLANKNFFLDLFINFVLKESYYDKNFFGKSEEKISKNMENIFMEENFYNSYFSIKGDSFLNKTLILKNDSFFKDVYKQFLNSTFFIESFGKYRSGFRPNKQRGRERSFEKLDVDREDWLSFSINDLIIDRDEKMTNTFRIMRQFEKGFFSREFNVNLNSFKKEKNLFLRTFFIPQDNFFFET